MSDDPTPLLPGMIHYGWRKIFTNEFRSAGGDWRPSDDARWIPVYVRQSDLLSVKPTGMEDGAYGGFIGE